MLIELLFSLLAVFLLLVITEVLWRRHKLGVEVGRKIVHIGTGVIVAFWPHFLNWTIIQAVALLMLAVILVSYKFSIIKSIHSVERLTKGEILYPVGIAVCAFLEPAPWVFSVAILHLALADGLAGIVGVHYGKSTRYQIISHGKSLVGSLTFFVTSFLIFAGATLVVSETSLPHLYGWFIWAALALTVVENLSWYGLDDITVPVSVIVILTLLPSS
jgi:phytol kinase